jgi:hypothetical protein
MTAVDFRELAAMNLGEYESGQEQITRWGSWRILGMPKICELTGKIIEAQKEIKVNKSASLSCQVHFGRGETYTGWFGKTMVCVNGTMIEMIEDTIVQIPRGSLHFSFSVGGESIFHELQKGPDCNEDDILRSSDKYKKTEELNTDEEIVAFQVAVAKDRYETEDMSQVFHPNDFMPVVLDLMESHDGGFNNQGFIKELKNYFGEILQKCKTLHAQLTPLPNNDTSKLISTQKLG